MGILSSKHRWIIGVALSVGGCTVANIGINLQKLSHIKDDNQNVSDRNYINITSPIWLIGFSFNLIGALADLSSFAFADVSLLAPLGALTLAFNLCIAPAIIKTEKISKSDVFNTSVILIGTIISIVFGSKEAHDFSLNDLMGLWVQITFLVYIFMFLSFLIYHFYSIYHIRLREINNATLPNDHKLRAFLYSAVAGAFGSWTVLFTKSSAEIVKQAAYGFDEFTHVFPYFCFLGLCGSLYLQMRFLNIGLVYGDALFVIPVYQVFWVSCNVISSMIYFKDYQRMELAEIFLFMFGVCVTLFGIYLLSRRSMTSRESEVKTVEEPSQTEHIDENTILLDSETIASPLLYNTILESPILSTSDDSVHDNINNIIKMNRDKIFPSELISDGGL